MGGTWQTLHAACGVQHEEGQASSSADKDSLILAAGPEGEH